MSPDAGPRGLRLWLLVATPLVVQFAVVGLGAALLRAAGLIDGGETTLARLPEALLLLGAYIVFGASIWLVARALGAPLRLLALRRTPLVQGAALAGLGLVAGVAVSAALEPVFHGAASQHLRVGDVSSLANGAALVLSTLTITVGAALTEELYFRGLLYGRLDARFGAASAVVGSAGVFGLAHFAPAAFPSLFALGLILGLLRLRTASVWPGIGLHAANNALAVAALLLAAR
ncbi:MAG: CPBP family intramembrane glutamic endopeptidase [Gaiellales bacterium]